jgi:hypothetical protein
MKDKNRFLFTQCFGFAVAFICGLTSLILEIKIIIKGVFPFLLSSQNKYILLISAFITGCIVLAAAGISLWLFGRLLVFLNILSPEEAKSYLYSNPWKNKRNAKSTYLRKL